MPVRPRTAPNIWDTTARVPPSVELEPTPHPTLSRSQGERMKGEGLRNFALSRRAPGVIAAELDSLSEWKFRRKVNRVGLAAHITFPRITAAFAPTAGVYLAAERAADLRTARAGVHVRDSTIAPDRADEFLRLAHVVCENGTGQALRDAVLDCNRFIE